MNKYTCHPRECETSEAFQARLAYQKQEEVDYHNACNNTWEKLSPSWKDPCIKSASGY